MHESAKANGRVPLPHIPVSTNSNSLQYQFLYCCMHSEICERILRQAVRRMSGDVGNAQTALVVNV